VASFSILISTTAIVASATITTVTSLIAAGRLTLTLAVLTAGGRSTGLRSPSCSRRTLLTLLRVVFHVYWV
jgi:hypothetical protein